MDRPDSLETESRPPPISCVFSYLSYYMVGGALMFSYFVWVFLLFLFFLCSGGLALGHSPPWLLFLISYSPRAPPAISSFVWVSCVSCFPVFSMLGLGK